MAITATTISAAILVNDLTVPVTSATGFAFSSTAPQYVKVDNEYMLIHPSYAGSTSKNIPVYRRGDQGSVQVAHNALAVCTTGLLSDLPVLPAFADSASAGFDSNPGWFDNYVTYSVSGAIAVPVTNTMVTLDKAGVAIMTLAAPTAGSDGVVLYICTATAQAHTVTATTLVADGASGSPHTTITFTTGYKGQGITLISCQGLWNVLANQNTTIT